jgi:hypothetical protein
MPLGLSQTPNVLAAALIVLAGTIARGASWNEELFGDLSSEPTSPTPLTIVHPANFITGSVGGGDFDFVLLNVPTFHTLDAITLTSYSGPSQSFVGLQAGSAWTAGTGFAINTTALMGWTHFGPAASVLGAGVGQDVFDNLATPNAGSTGFARPLGPGNYTLMVQDTGGSVAYQFRFNLTYDLRPVGDFNGDFLINRFDLAKWRDDFSLNAGSDANADGDSDGHDFIVWQRNLNRVNFDAGAIPEPAALPLVAGAWCALARSRRCRHTGPR